MQNNSLGIQIILYVYDCARVQKKTNTKSTYVSLKITLIYTDIHITNECIWPINVRIMFIILSVDQCGKDFVGRKAAGRLHNCDMQVQ